MDKRAVFVKTELIAWIIALSLFFAAEASRCPQRVLCSVRYAGEPYYSQVNHAQSS